MAAFSLIRPTFQPLRLGRISTFHAVTRRPDKRSAIRHFARVQMPDGGFQLYPAYGLSGDNKSPLIVDKRLLICRGEDRAKIHLCA